MAVAVGLLECCAPGLGGRVMLMTAGPCTTGPGMVVGQDLAEPFRNHKVCNAISHIYTIYVVYIYTYMYICIYARSNE